MSALVLVPPKKAASWARLCLTLCAALAWAAQPACALAEIPGFEDMLEEDQVAQKTLYDMMMDFIENGFADYYQTGRRDYLDKKVAATAGIVYLFHLTIDEHREYRGRHIHDLFLVRGRGSEIFGKKSSINTELWCISQQEYKGNIYEYWLYRHWTYGRLGKNYNKYCEFIITRAQSRKDRRTILEKSPQFIREYAVDAGFSFVFPQDAFQAKMLGQGFINCPKCCDDFKDKYPVCPRVP